MSQLKGEATARLIAAGLHDPAVEARGQIDLKPVLRERVLPQDDVPVAAGADEHVAVQTQDAAGSVTKTRTSSSPGVEAAIADPLVITRPAIGFSAGTAADARVRGRGRALSRRGPGGWT